jgi:hypothetical protein
VSKRQVLVCNASKRYSKDGANDKRCRSLAEGRRAHQESPPIRIYRSSRWYRTGPQGVVNCYLVTAKDDENHRFFAYYTKRQMGQIRSEFGHRFKFCLSQLVPPNGETPCAGDLAGEQH